MSNLGICLQTLVPVRSEPSETAELHTQLLFGETYSVLTLRDNWVCIKIDFDNQEGWIDRKLFEPITENEKKEILECKSTILNTPITFADVSDKKIPLIAGSNFYKNSGDDFLISGNVYKLNKQEGLDLIETAKQFLSAPYLWGGKSILGIDCSGFTQVVFKTQGINLFRNASQQVIQGKTIEFIDQAQTGDLAFFDNEEGDIIHVGILLDSSTIIHASGWVRIDNIDHNGIYKKEDEKYSHHLRIIKRLR